MYIARRTGGGRGVYEIAGTTASGQTSADLLDREIVFELAPDLRFNTGVGLHVQGGKHRLRLDGGDIQVQRQIAAVLMLPRPRRADEGLGESPTIIRSQQYVIERIHLSYVDTTPAHQAIVVPSTVEVMNARTSTIFSVQERLAMLNFVWDRANQLPGSLRVLVDRHRSLVTAGSPITEECERVVAEIQRQLIQANVGLDESDDPLPRLARLLGLDSLETIGSLPPDGGEFDIEGHFDPATITTVPERVRRAIIQRRGQRLFRQTLLRAYGGRCQVTGYDGEPALEAAHIIPYSEGGEYTNDPRNGLLLRADIHILFDLGLIRIAPGSLTINVMPPLDGSRYRTLHGRQLAVSPVLRPSDKALETRWEMYNQSE